MNIQNIKMALTKQAQLLGVSPVVMTAKTASTLNNPSTITAASKTSAAVKDTLHITVSADTVIAPVTISANPTVPPNIQKIPSERQEPVTITSSLQTPTLPAVFTARADSRRAETCA